MGLFSTKDPWVHPARIIDTYELIYVLKGDFYMQEGDKIYHLKPNQIFFLSPNVRHTGLEKTQGAVKFYWLHFYCDCFEKLAIEKLISNHEVEREQSVFRELMNMWLMGQRELCDIKLAEILFRIRGTKKQEFSKPVSEIIEYIRINIQNKLTVLEIAKEFGYNKDYCSRLFKRSMGVSLQEYVNKVRMRYIKAHLLNTNDSIKEIAALYHFDDENTFIKFFKYHSNQTPTEYRRRHNKVHINKH